jgi:hypothetical protein
MTPTGLDKRLGGDNLVQDRGGYTPRATPLGVAQKILHGIIIFPVFLSELALLLSPSSLSSATSAISPVYSPHVLGPDASLPRSFPAPCRPSAPTPRAPARPPPTPSAAAAPALLRTCWFAALLRCVPTPSAGPPHLHRSCWSPKGEVPEESGETKFEEPKRCSRAEDRGHDEGSEQ